MGKATAFMDLFPLPFRFRPGQGYTRVNTKLRTDVRSERGRAGRVGGNIGGCSAKVTGSNDQSWARISTRCGHPTLAWKPKTNVVPPHCALAWVGRPKGEGPRLFDAVSRCQGFGGARVDEVTRNTHSPEEVSGRGEAAQGRPDRGHDQRVRAHQRRSRARHQDRAGSRRDSRSRSFRLSDVRQG